MTVVAHRVDCKNETWTKQGPKLAPDTSETIRRTGSMVLTDLPCIQNSLLGGSEISVQCR
jgi:hypothetical protein